MELGTILCLLSLAVLRTGQAENRPLVETKYGKLLGVTVPVKETPTTVDAFFGVPFAKPPVGPLRFKNPEAPEPWKSIRDASQFPPICVQPPKTLQDFALVFKSSFQIPPVSEDCLYLNVFTPSHRQRGLKLPVMVFIHGGGLAVGGASIFDGSALSAYEDMVVVVIQHRLGILGFFSTGDDELRGNFGFMDQVAALRWVQENIADFGGDPQYVTIFGVSTGGACVAAHVLSPLSKGLFHRAVSGSGAMLMPGMVMNKSEDFTLYREVLIRSNFLSLETNLLLVSKFFDCEPSSVVECLKQKSEKEILAVVVDKMKFMPQSASVDGVFLPKLPEEILANNDISHVPYMLGYCNHEFSWLATKGRTFQEARTVMEICTTKYAVIWFICIDDRYMLLNVEGIIEGMNREVVQRELQKLKLMGFNPSDIPTIMDEYLVDAKDPFELRNGFLEIGLDKLFAMPLLKSAKYHRDSGNPVYFYVFQHRSSLLADSRPDFVEADHTDDLLYLFGGPFLRDGILFASKVTEDEKLLSRIYMRYWANFARTGDPNGPGLAEWPLYDAKQRYLGIQVKPKVFARLKEDKYKFWNEILPMKTKKGDHTEL
ncbi:fatty acyl-CoA hydrolase precursor, medium chain-like [Gastrophryne carolinensis]